MTRRLNILQITRIAMGRADHFRRHGVKTRLRGHNGRLNFFTDYQKGLACRWSKACKRRFSKDREN